MRINENVKGLDMLIPVSLELDHPTKEQILSCIRDQHRSFGFTTFILTAPSAGWRSVGHPDRSVYTKNAKLFRDVSRELAPEGIRCGWWVTTTLKSGRREDLTAMVRANGEQSPFANCPLDPNFVKNFSENIAHFASIAHPAFIVTEDDYSVHAGSSEYGCFCHHHLGEFAKRQGREYTREELVGIFKAGGAESEKLLRAWRELARDSLVELAAATRRALDRETPEIPMGYFQAGSADRDGDCTLAVARAMAGSAHTPFSRLHGSVYCQNGSAKEIPTVIFNSIYSRQHCEELLPYHESDTFPHNAFFMSASYMRGMMSAVYSAGYVGSVFQTQQLLDDPCEERAYGKMFAAERKRFGEMSRLSSLCRLCGAEIGYDPFYNTLDNYGGTATPVWTRPVALFGIPYVTTGSKVSFWDARRARHADESEVMEYLSRGMILDGDAAYELCRRGFGKYIGVHVGDDVASGMLQYDLAAREVLCDGVLPDLAGRHMPSPHMFAQGRNGFLRRLTVTEQGCEVLTELISFLGDRVTPAVTRFQNSLGGRVAVMGMTLYDDRKKTPNLSQSLYNYRRQRLIHELSEWCGCDFAYVTSSADVFTVMNLPKDRSAVDFDMMLTLINLCEDPAEGLKVKLPQGHRNVRSVRRVDQNGEWQPIEFSLCDGTLSLNYKVAQTEPFCILLSDK